MPRHQVLLRREPLSKTADQKEKVCLAQIKFEAVLQKFDELEKRAKDLVDTKIKLIRAQTDNHLRKGPEPPDSRARSSSSDRGRCRTPQCFQRPRPLVKSLDRGNFRRGGAPHEEPAMTFKRWPYAGELVLSSGGSPLAIQNALPENCANVHIPCKNGVIVVRPSKMNVTSEVLMELDANALNQMKTLQANLGVTLDMATKMGIM